MSSFGFLRAAGGALIASIAALSCSDSTAPASTEACAPPRPAAGAIAVDGDISIVDAQFTQATQKADGSIPMVLGGNGAAVNVVMSSTSESTESMQLVLCLQRSNGTIVRADTITAILQSGASASLELPSAQFRIPPEALEAGLRWRVVRDPGGLRPDESAPNDAFPRDKARALATAEVPVLKLRFIPVVLTAHGNATGDVNQGNLGEYTRMVRSVHPVGALVASVGTPFSTAQSFGTPPTGGGEATAFWLPVLQQIDQARVLEAEPGEYWIGVVRPPTGFTQVLNGGIAYVPGSGTSTGQGTRTSMVTTVGWASNPAFTRNTVAHELGHNFGRGHAPCADGQLPLGIDVAFPYPSGRIGVVGHDVRGWMDGRASTAVSVPVSHGDIMGYCAQNWVSDYTYRAVLNFRTEASAGAGTAAMQSAPVVQRTMMISGTVVDGEGVTLNPAFIVDARATAPERAGPYRLEGRARDGSVLFTRDFAPSVIDHAPGAGHFTFTIPFTEAIESSLESIEVSGPAGSARVSRRERARGARISGGTMSARRNASGLAMLSCADESARGILVRDASTGSLLASTNAASATFSAPRGTELTVLCSDGIQTVAARGIVP